MLVAFPKFMLFSCDITVFLNPWLSSEGNGNNDDINIISVVMIIYESLSECPNVRYIFNANWQVSIVYYYLTCFVWAREIPDWKVWLPPSFFAYVNLKNAISSSLSKNAFV